MHHLFKFLWKISKLIRFFFYVLREIFVANLRVAYHVIMPGSIAKPGVIAIPLDCKTVIEIAWLSNIISLTPGTLVLDISSDQKTIYVHVMTIDDIDQLKKSIKQQFEKPILELLQ